MYFCCSLFLLIPLFLLFKKIIIYVFYLNVDTFLLFIIFCVAFFCFLFFLSSLMVYFIFVFVVHGL
jgi:hypothetical protein